ncbi:MAG TPA: hypothetical protein VFR24_27375 [Candidatus Angelobacter sp.]|nr:hypothetical protein [Candidatus Angelobacter sp.]
MPLSITHAKTNTVPDDPSKVTAGGILASDWNSLHTVSGSLAFGDLTGNISTSQMAGGASASSSTFWRGDGSWSNALTGPLILNPPSVSTTQGLIITQSLPGSTSQTTAFDFNVINASNSGYSVPLTGAVDPVFGIVPHVSAFTAYMNVSGPSSGNDNNGLWGAIAETAPVGFIKGITGSAYSNINSGDALYGVAGGALTGASANVQYAVGVLSESISAVGGAITNRFGFLAGGGDGSNVQGTSIDAAYGVFPISAAPFKNALFLDTFGGTVQPLASNGSVISSDGALTTGSLINLPNATFTADIINVPNLHIDGSGIFRTQIQETINTNGTVGPVINNNSTGGSAFSVSSFFNSANFANFGIGGTGLTGSAAILANRAIVQGSTSSAGIAINNQGANPTLFGTSNTEVIRILNGLSIGTTSDPGSGLIYLNSASFLMRNKTSWNNGAAANTATLTNAPAAGNPTKWVPIDDNGTTRYIPSW